MLGCMNVHPRGTADAAVTLWVSGHRKAALCRPCALELATYLQHGAAGSPFEAVIGEVKVKPVTQES